MADNWIDIIGNLSTINTQAIKALLGKSFYYTMLKHKDNLLSDSCKDSNPFEMYETLSMVIKPKIKDEPKYTYIGTKITVDKNNSKIKKIEHGVEIPMKKFSNITGEVKLALSFMLNKYIFECHSYFLDNRNTFITSNNILDKICEYSESHISLPIAPAMIKLSTIIDVEKSVQDSYCNLSTKLQENSKVLFKDSNDEYPKKQLELVVEVYVKFIKIIAIFMTSLLYEKRQAVSGLFLYGILRQINMILKQTNSKIDEELLERMKD